MAPVQTYEVQEQQFQKSSESKQTCVQDFEVQECIDSPKAPCEDVHAVDPWTDNSIDHVQRARLPDIHAEFQDRSQRHCGWVFALMFPMCCGYCCNSRLQTNS